MTYPDSEHWAKHWEKRAHEIEKERRECEAERDALQQRVGELEAGSLTFEGKVVTQDEIALALLHHETCQELTCSKDIER